MFPLFSIFIPRRTKTDIFNDYFRFLLFWRLFHFRVLSWDEDLFIGLLIRLRFDATLLENSTACFSAVSRPIRHEGFLHGGLNGPYWLGPRDANEKVN